MACLYRGANCASSRSNSVHVHASHASPRRGAGRAVRRVGEVSTRWMGNRKGESSSHVQIWPLMSTLLKAFARAASKRLPALPVRNTIVSEWSSRRCWPPKSRMNCAESASDSNPSSSVTNRSLTSGLYLSHVSTAHTQTCEGLTLCTCYTVLLGVL